MTDEQYPCEQYRKAYNAHEWAEDAALTALKESLSRQDMTTLMSLADPENNWESRSSLSCWIVEAASELLDEKLEALCLLSV